jgi:GNAT superfamily N-acetyltransferase
MDIHVKELAAADRPAIEMHLRALNSEDRRLRFGARMQDAALLAYAGRVDFDRDAVFGVIGSSLQLLGWAHLAWSEGLAEFGISVLEEERGRGIGSKLLARAHMHARNWGSRSLFMHCLSENAVMLHLARKQEMRIVAGSGETDAWLNLLPADAASRLSELSDQRVALIDYALKSETASARKQTECVAA